MPKYIITANSIGTVGDTTIYNYENLTDFRLLVEALKSLQAAPSLKLPERQELQSAVTEMESALHSSDQVALKATFLRLSPRLRIFLSSIGANLTSDVLVAAFTHAMKHLNTLQSLFH